MDIATPIGYATTFGLIVMAIFIGGDFMSFVDPVSGLIVIGGTIGASFINYPMGDVFNIVPLLLKTIKGAGQTPEASVIEMVNLSQVARKDGINALEPKIKDLDSELMKRGLQMMVDGSEPEAVEDALYLESEKIGERHAAGAELLSMMGTYAPAFGMIGTLIGLVLMLQNMDDPASIGPSMAVALITTFYGALLSNAIFIPASGKLRVFARKEELVRDIQIGGLVSIAGNENPRMTEQKLLGYLQPSKRVSQFD